MGARDVFVGRRDELALAERAIERSADGAGGLLVFTGEAGIGKTSLVERVAERAAQRGARVAWGRCWEAGGAPPYWPWLEIFRALDEEPPFEEEQSGELHARDLRFRQLDRAARKLEALARERPLTLVLDDMHASDLRSLELLHVLVRRLRTLPALVLVTYRDAEARLAPEVEQRLAKIGREGEVHALGRLSPDEVAAWVHEVSPSADAAAAARIFEASEGNALFVREALRLGAERGAAHLPQGMRAVLDEHLGRLSPDARALLSAASVLGRHFDVDDACALAGLDRDEGHRLLAEAGDAGILTASARANELAFAHILLRERLHGSLPPSRRAALHRGAGGRLLRRDRVSAAHHMLEGADAESIADAARAALAASAAAAATLAFEEAARVAERALEAIERHAAPGELDGPTCELEIVRAESLMRIGEVAVAKDASIRAAGLARRIGRADLEARAALAYATEIETGHVDPKMVRLLEDSLSSLDRQDSQLRARVLARLAAAIVPPEDASDIARMHTLVEEARAMARRLGDTATLLYVLQFTSSARGYVTSADVRFEDCRELVTLAATLERPTVLLQVAGWWVSCLRERGMREDAAMALESYRDLLRDFPQPHYRWRVPLLECVGALLEGARDREEAFAAQALRVAEEHGVRPGLFCWATSRMSAALLRSPPSLGPDGARVVAMGAADPLPPAVSRPWRSRSPTGPTRPSGSSAPTTIRSRASRWLSCAARRSRWSATGSSPSRASTR